MKIKVSVLALCLISALCSRYSKRACASLYEDQENVSAKVEERLQKELDKVFGKNKTTALVRIEFMI